MNTIEKNWSKTLLSSYSYLETICGAIDKTVLNYGINSRISSDAEYVACKMISLTERKKFLINVKILIDNILRKLDSDYARILMLKYVDKIKCETASQVLKISIRTYFRKANLGIAQFARVLTQFGYTPEKLFSMFKDEQWVMEIFDAYNKKHIADLEAENLHFLGIAISSLRSKTARAY